MTFEIYIIQKTDLIFQKLTTGKFANWRVIFFVTGLIFLCTFPNYHFFIDGTLDNRIEFINRQIEHPFDHSNFINLDPGSHEAKRAFRIFIPCLAHVLNLNFTGVLIIQHITGFIFLYLFIDYLGKQTKDKLLASYLVLGIMSVYLGKTFFYDIVAFYDFFAFFFMLLIIITSNKALNFLYAVCGGFTDERFIVALPILVLFKIYTGLGYSIKNIFAELYPFIMAVAAIMITRYYLSQTYNLHIPKINSGNVGLQVLKDNFHFIPIGIFSGLEFLWFLVLCAFFELRKAGKKLLSILIFLSVVQVILVSLMVFDITRSLSYLFPLIIFAIIILVRENRLSYYRNSIKLCCIGCFAITTFYVMGPNDSDWMSPILPKIIKLF